MNRRFIGGVAVIVSILGVVVQYVPPLMVGQWIDRDVLPRWLPMFETLGTTVTLYTTVAEFVGPLVTVLLALGFGYYIGRRLDVASEYRRFVVTVAAGSLLAVAVVWSLMLWYASGVSFPFDLGTLLILFGVFVRLFVAVSLVVIISAFAGAALAHLETAGPTPPQPTGTDTNIPSNRSRETVDDADIP